MEGEPSSHLLNQLIEELGFRETPQLLNLRAQIIHELSSLREVSPLPAQLIYLRTQYHLKAEAVVNQLPPEQFSKAQIGLIIATAKMFQEANWHGRFLEEITDASIYARGMGFNDLAQTLQTFLETNPPQ